MNVGIERFEEANVGINFLSLSNISIKRFSMVIIGLHDEFNYREW